MTSFSFPKKFRCPTIVFSTITCAQLNSFPVAFERENLTPQTQATCLPSLRTPTPGSPSVVEIVVYTPSDTLMVAVPLLGVRRSTLSSPPFFLQRVSPFFDAFLAHPEAFFWSFVRLLCLRRHPVPPTAFPSCPHGSTPIPPSTIFHLPKFLIPGCPF